MDGVKMGPFLSTGNPRVSDFPLQQALLLTISLIMPCTMSAALDLLKLYM